MKKIKLERLKLILLILVISSFFGITSQVEAEIIFSDNFDEYADLSELSAVWTNNADNIQLLEGVDCYGGSGKCVRLFWTVGGRDLNGILKNLYPPQPIITVSFKFKKIGSLDYGCKFLKFFGVRDGNSYSNVTFTHQYETGRYISPVSYGAGVSISNDTTCAPRWADDSLGPYPMHCNDGVGNIIKYQPTWTNGHKITDHEWHSFKAVAVMSSDDGTNVNADGRFIVYIDGVYDWEIINTINRNIANTRGYSSVSLGDYAKDYNEDFGIVYDDIVIQDVVDTGVAICDASHLNLCADQISCEGVGGNWCNNTCQANPCSTEIRADVNQDNQITSTDAMLILRKSLNLDMSQTNWQDSPTTGDVNCDNTINSTDAMLILRKSLGLDMSGTGWCAE